MTWSDETLKWKTTISVDGGKDAEYSQSYDIVSDYVISAIGQLCKPKGFDIPGLSDFEGKVMHSARWDRGYDLTGKKVAIIGTGKSTAVHMRGKADPERCYGSTSRPRDREGYQTSHRVPENARFCHSTPRSCSPSVAATVEVLHPATAQTNSSRKHELSRTLPCRCNSE